MNVRDTTFVTRVDGRRIPGLSRYAQRRLTADCRKVCRRTGCSAWYQHRIGEVQFHPGDKPHGGCVGVQAVQKGRYLGVDVEQACRDIRSASMTLKHKLQILEESERELERERDREVRRLAEQGGQDLFDRMRYVRRKLVDPRSRPTVLVG